MGTVCRGVAIRVSETGGRSDVPVGSVAVPWFFCLLGQGMHAQDVWYTCVICVPDEYRMNGYSEIEREKANLINATSISLEDRKSVV